MSVLRFRRVGESRTFARLADAISIGNAPELEPRTIAARMLLASPLVRGATLYTGVTVEADTPAAPMAPRSNDVTPSTAEEAATFLRETITAAVERSLAGVRRVAVLTGGGTDSAALFALAVEWAKRSGGEAFGIALDFDGPGDDRPHLRSLERHLQCEIVRVHPTAAAARFGSVLAGVDAAPLTWPGAPMEIELLARARAHGAQVVLMGVGADELLDGDPRALASLLRRGRVREALDEAQKLEGFVRPARSRFDWLLRPLLAGALPLTARRSLARRGRPAPAPWSGSILRAVHRELAEMHTERALALRDGPQFRLQAFASAPHHEHLRWLRHQEVVAAGIERRDPYLDVQLADAVLRLPPIFLLQGGVRRGLFREAMRGVLPDSLRKRMDKASFEPAFASFVEAADGWSSLRPLLDLRCLSALRLVDDVGSFRSEFEQLVAHPHESDGWGTVWPVLAIEAFLRERGRATA